MFVKCCGSCLVRGCYSRSYTSRGQGDMEMRERSSFLDARVHPRGDIQHHRDRAPGWKGLPVHWWNRHGHLSSSQRKEKSVFHLAISAQMMTPTTRSPGNSYMMRGGPARAVGPGPGEHYSGHRYPPHGSIITSPTTPTSKVLKFLSNRRDGAPTMYLVLCHLPTGSQKNKLYHPSPLFLCSENDIQDWGSATR